MNGRLGIALRRATLVDADALAGLNHHAQMIHHRRVPEWFPPPGDPEVVGLLRTLLRREGAVGFIAEQEGRPVGYALACVHHRPATPLTCAGTWMDLDQIAVAPEARRQGVARKLCEQVIAHARELHLDEVSLNVWAFNTEAQALFTSMGFEPASMRLTLDTRERGGGWERG